MLNKEDLKFENMPPDPGGMRPPYSPRGVRLTHIPTGTIVECTFKTSQHKNYRTAIEMIEWALMDEENT